MRRRKMLLHANRQTLAVDGGTPTIPEGPPAWPPADEYVRENLLAAYEDGSWGQYHGPNVARLEEVVARRHEVAHALACSSGTIAVEIALRGLNVGPGDEVILAAYDFSGNFRAIEATGARPVLVDLQPGSWTIDPDQVQAAVGEKTKAILVSHLHAGIAPMRQLMEIAAQRGVAVVEDACQAQGALVEGRPAGTWGDVGVWSFGGSKLLTSGRGGAIFTDNAQIHQRAKVFCQRGNHAFALSELQAAVLLPQIAKLTDRNERRQENAALLYEQTATISALTPPHPHPPATRASFYKVSWFFNADSLTDCPRERFIAAARAEGVALDAGFRGFARRPASRCGKPFPLPQAERAAQSTLVLHHPVLLETPQTVTRVAEALAKVAAAHGMDEPGEP